MVEKFKILRTYFRDPHFGTPKFCQISYLPYISFLKNFIGLALKMKKFKFWTGRLGETPHRGTPDFRRVPVILDIYNSS